MTRPALAVGAVSIREDGQVAGSTPPDPQTGSASVVLDPLDFVHAVVTQIPDAKKHWVRYYGGYSHRMRATVRAKHAVVDAATGDGGALLLPQPRWSRSQSRMAPPASSRESRGPQYMGLTAS